jgi:type IV pilus assembly protein PilB
MAILAPTETETAAMTTVQPGGPLRLDHEFFEHEVRPHLGAVLLKSKLLRPEQLDEALAQQATERKLLGEILVERGWIFPQDVARALAVQHGLDYIDIHHLSVDPAAAVLLDPSIGQRHSAIPVRFLANGTVLVAVADPTSEGLLEVITAIARPIAFAVTEAADIRGAWRLLLQGFRP